jgi:hypothetical protein
MKRLLVRAGFLAAAVGMVLPGIAAAQPGGWEQGPPVPLGRIRYAHTQCPNDTARFYVISGQDRTFNPTITTERFDTATDTWEQLPSVPDVRVGATAVCLGNTIHLLGGADRFGHGTTTHFVLKLGDKEWTEAAPLPRPVVGAASGGSGNRIYLAGGDDDFDPPGVSAEVDVFDTVTNSWSQSEKMPHPATFAGSAQHGRYLYVVGGFDDNSPAANVRATQRLDTLTGGWTTGPDIADAPADFALVATGSALYAIGGDADGGQFKEPTATVRRLDLTRWPGGSWTTEADPLPEPVAANNGGFATSDRRIWSVGGATPGVGISDLVFVKAVR